MSIPPFPRDSSQAPWALHPTTRVLLSRVMARTRLTNLFLKWASVSRLFTIITFFYHTTSTFFHHAPPYHISTTFSHSITHLLITLSKCCQSTELIWAFCFINFPILLPRLWNKSKKPRRKTTSPASGKWGSRASLRFERLNFSINPRKLSLLYQSLFLNRSETQGRSTWVYCPTQPVLTPQSTTPANHRFDSYHGWYLLRSPRSQLRILDVLKFRNVSLQSTKHTGSNNQLNKTKKEMLIIKIIPFIFENLHILNRDSELNQSRILSFFIYSS